MAFQTVEFWMWPSNLTSVGTAVETIAQKPTLTYAQAGALINNTALGYGNVEWLCAGAGQTSRPPIVVAPHTWHHVAMVNTNFNAISNAVLYVDGVAVDTNTLAQAQNAMVSLGDNAATNSPFLGRLAMVRFSSVARYSGNFTPPTNYPSYDVYTYGQYICGQSSGTNTLNDYGLFGNNMTINLDTNGAAPRWLQVEFP